MPKNGEKVNWQGNIFCDACEHLVERIEYEEIFSGKYGIDMVARPPEGLPKSKLLRPSFSPEGITAFEFTSEFDIGNKSIDELSRKAEGLRIDNDSISGGVLICNIKASDRLLEYGIKRNFQVFLWDYRYSHFLSTKFMICQMWSKIGRPHERRLDDNVTYIWCLEHPLSKEIFQARIGLFFDNPLLEVSARELENAIKHITETITKESMTAGYLPIQVITTVFTAGFARKDLYNRIDLLLDKYSSDDIAYVQSKGPIRVFYLAPFYSDLMMTID